jgi:hypothetical protein
MDAFLRLLRYATPHRAVIAGAALAMVVYGAPKAISASLRFRFLLFICSRALAPTSPVT